ncbi:hypothetical protein VNO77_04088 [Canavalia gladiata]|uniref:Uncharacterized protein n=1 Tax=Canavalia gladiata TaxID=3824 RepID=A0AAN9MXZ4_CANGL
MTDPPLESRESDSYAHKSDLLAACKDPTERATFGNDGGQISSQRMGRIQARVTPITLATCSLITWLVSNLNGSYNDS